MKERIFKVTLGKAEFHAVEGTEIWSYKLPMKRRYTRLLPKQSVQIGEETCLVLEAPKRVVFRRRWSRETYSLAIRLAYIVVDPIDKEEFIELHF